MIKRRRCGLLRVRAAQGRCGQDESGERRAPATGEGGCGPEPLGVAALTSTTLPASSCSGPAANTRCTLSSLSYVTNLQRHRKRAPGEQPVAIPDARRAPRAARTAASAALRAPEASRPVGVGINHDLGLGDGAECGKVGAKVVCGQGGAPRGRHSCACSARNGRVQARGVQARRTPTFRGGGGESAHKHLARARGAPRRLLPERDGRLALDLRTQEMLCMVSCFGSRAAPPSRVDDGTHRALVDQVRPVLDGERGGLRLLELDEAKAAREPGLPIHHHHLGARTQRVSRAPPSVSLRPALCPSRARCRRRHVAVAARSTGSGLRMGGQIIWVAVHGARCCLTALPSGSPRPPAARTA